MTVLCVQTEKRAGTHAIDHRTASNAAAFRQMARLPVSAGSRLAETPQHRNQEISVSTIDGASPTNPAEVPGMSPQRVPRITLVIHSSSQNERSSVASSPQPMVPTPSKTASLAVRQQRGGQHELADPTWFGRLERLLQSWPITLRLALLVAIVLTGTAAVAATLGIGGQLLLAALGLRARRNRQRRATTLTQNRAALEEDGR